jgi:hypothetical protein
MTLMSVLVYVPEWQLLEFEVRYRLRCTSELEGLLMEKQFLKHLYIYNRDCLCIEEAIEGLKDHFNIEKTGENLKSFHWN